MTHLHIHAPQSTDRILLRLDCPTCQCRTFFTRFYTPWYGWDSTCLKCGDSWADDEMHDRPFLRGWRQKSIGGAKKRWRAWDQAAADAARAELVEDIG